MVANSTVLIIAAHPDDEVLGAGGTIATHTASGDDVHILFLSDGVTARDHSFDGEARAPDIALREQMGRSAAEILGTQPPRFLRLPDNRLDGSMLIDIVKQIEPVLHEIRPDVVYTNHGGDLNVDHKIAQQAVMTAARPIPDSSVKAIYAFETLSSTDWGSAATTESFRPVRFVGIAEHIDRKLEALACYEPELRPFPHARSPEAVKALATWRGAFIGLPAAEAFEVIREIL